MLTKTLAVGPIVVLGLFTVACGAGETEPSGEQSAALTDSDGNCDVSSFADCVAGGGGRACAKQWCTGACTADVAACVGGGGGAPCADRCAGTVGGGNGGGRSAPSCVPQEEWTAVGTAECGFTIPGKTDSSATPGEAKATCTRECDGKLDHCSVWHEWNGRAMCTVGGPIDEAGNPW
jgi:hypothetical protein